MLVSAFATNSFICFDKANSGNSIGWGTIVNGRINTFPVYTSKGTISFEGGSPTTYFVIDRGRD
jgi:hypothetical protein